MIPNTPRCPNPSSYRKQEPAALCAALRTRLLEIVSRNGGHLASNLGLVELTVALHQVFDTGSDRLVFDVGHQCYPHKLLTGRDGAMDTLRTFGGVAGYPKPAESNHDAFIAGHASNSVSVALGMARQRTLQGENYSVIALLGDGALTGGLAYEGLSDAGQSGEPLVVILNDNGMSITQSVGGVAYHLAHQRLKPQYLRFKEGYRSVMKVLPLGGHIYRFTHRLKKAIKEGILPCSMFENMGFTYLGPVDGHNVELLTRILRYAKEVKSPVLLHIRTVKGKGYSPAEGEPNLFHGVAPFDIATGKPIKPSGPSFSSVFGDTLCRLARRDDRICAVTAAMESGTGLEGFVRNYPDRCFDVGIAEGHAVAMSAGMAKQGGLPVFAVYSSFLQRGYDQLLHDVGIQNLHVVFGVDRAGLVGEDGETHHGLFDVAYLHTVPGMTVLAPASFSELSSMLELALFDRTGPVAVRYPRGGEGSFRDNSGPAPTVSLRTGGDLTLLGYGPMTATLLEVALRLEGVGISAEVVKMNTIQPPDWTILEHSVARTGRLLVAEEAVSMDCVGCRAVVALTLRGIALNCVALCNCGDGYIPHGTIAQLRALCGLDADSLYHKALEVCNHGR